MKGLKRVSSVDPLDAPEIKAEETLFTHIAVIVLKSSIPHTKV